MALTRREFLAIGSAAGIRAVRFGIGTRKVPSFQTPLRIPPILSPVRSDGNTDYYEIVQREASVELLPGMKTKIWGYDGIFPGPTIKARQDRRTVVRYRNRLEIPTVVHLHGSMSPPESDGFPTDLVMPNSEKSHVYPNHRPGTLWYHDHTMDDTGRNIFMGLAGLYIVEGEEERNLALPRDGHDVPLIIQDRLFSSDGALVYKPDAIEGPMTDTILVNGTPWPRMEVDACKYRFRILNASNARSFHLALSTGQPFLQIATDIGLLSAPLRVRSLPLAMAERVEVIVDFSGHPLNTQIFLRDLSHNALAPSIMRFDVVRKRKDDSVVPNHLATLPLLSPESAQRHRTFVFTRGGGAAVRWSINGEQFDPDHAIAEVSLGEIEIWHLLNHSFRETHRVPHPIHLHLAAFQILERNGRRVPPYEGGLKDTVSLEIGNEARIIAKFEGYKGRYLLHCHNLEHEDRGMMARFDVV